MSGVKGGRGQVVLVCKSGFKKINRLTYNGKLKNTLLLNVVYLFKKVAFISINGFSLHIVIDVFDKASALCIC